MVAGSFGAGDGLGVQRPGPGRVDGQERTEEVFGQLHVAEPPGKFDGLLPERAPCLRLAPRHAEVSTPGRTMVRVSAMPSCVLSAAPGWAWSGSRGSFGMVLSRLTRQRCGLIHTDAWAGFRARSTASARSSQN